MSEDLVYEIARRLANTTDFLNPFESNTLILKSRETVNRIHPKLLQEVFNADIVNQYVDECKGTYVGLLVQSYNPEQLLDMLLKQEETKLVKTIRNKVNSAFFGRE